MPANVCRVSQDACIHEFYSESHTGTCVTWCRRYVKRRVISAVLHLAVLFFFSNELGKASFTDRFCLASSWLWLPLILKDSWKCLGWRSGANVRVWAVKEKTKPKKKHYMSSLFSEPWLINNRRVQQPVNVFRLTFFYIFYIFFLNLWMVAQTVLVPSKKDVCSIYSWPAGGEQSP